MRLRAPAKLNLYLRVLGERADGYHEIETLFERIDLADELTFEDDLRELALTCSDPTLSCGEDNLVLKAARLLRSTSGVAHGARVHLLKRIPIAAGLGGGSSDAAATLLGLNRLWNLGLQPSQLQPLAAQLGSDVPFFLSEALFAIGRGRGEICESLASVPPLAHVLVVPRERLSTNDIYRAFAQRGDGAQIGLTAPRPSLTMVAHALRNGSLGELAKGLWNDLEPVAIRRCPVIANIQSHLLACGALGSRLSGSGPSVFGLCTDARHAQDVAAQMRTRVAPSCRIEIIQTDGSSIEISRSEISHPAP